MRKQYDVRVVIASALWSFAVVSMLIGANKQGGVADVDTREAAHALLSPCLGSGIEHRACAASILEAT
jgi:hypothetical protein